MKIKDAPDAPPDQEGWVKAYDQYVKERDLNRGADG